MFCHIIVFSGFSKLWKCRYDGTSRQCNAGISILHHPTEIEHFDVKEMSDFWFRHKNLLRTKNSSLKWKGHCDVIHKCDSNSWCTVV